MIYLSFFICGSIWLSLICLVQLNSWLCSLAGLRLAQHHPEVVLLLILPPLLSLLLPTLDCTPVMGCYKFLLQPSWGTSFGGYDHNLWDPSNPLVYGPQRLCHIHQMNCDTIVTRTLCIWTICVAARNQMKWFLKYADGFL